MVDDQLAPAVEQIEQTGCAIRTLELVVLLDLDNRQPAALRG
jgi:hypothetical protein